MRWFYGLIGLAGVSLAFAMPARAAVDAFIWFDNVKGESTQRPGWFEIKDFSWGAGRGISSPTGASSDRGASAPNVREIHITRVIDKASPMFVQCAHTGCHYKTVRLSLRKAGGTQQEYLQYTLQNVMVSSYQTSSNSHMSSGGDRPMESLSLNFTKI